MLKQNPASKPLPGELDAEAFRPGVYFSRSRAYKLQQLQTRLRYGRGELIGLLVDQEYARHFPAGHGPDEADLG
jgi:hypothetical protein